MIIHSFALAAAYMLLPSPTRAQPATSDPAEQGRRLLTRASAALARGDFDVAVEHATRALRSDPSLAEAYLTRGHAYYDRGDFDRAWPDVRKWLQLNPGDPSGLGHELLGGLFAQRREYDQAIGNETKALAVSPDPSAYGIRGSAYLKLGRSDDALADFDKGLALDPRDHRLYGFRGLCYFMRRDYARAVPDLNKALEFLDADRDPVRALDEKPEQYLELLGESYFELDDYSPAATAWARLLNLKDRYRSKNAQSFAEAALASCLLRLGKPDKAKATYQKAVELDPIWADGVDAFMRKYPGATFTPKEKAVNAELVALFKR